MLGQLRRQVAAVAAAGADQARLAVEAVDLAPCAVRRRRAALRRQRLDPRAVLEQQAGAPVDRLADRRAVQHGDAGEVAGRAVGRADHEVAAVDRRQRAGARGERRQQLALGDHVGGQAAVDVAQAPRGDLQHVHDPRAGRGGAVLAGEDDPRARVARGRERRLVRPRALLRGEAPGAHEEAERAARGIVRRAFGDPLHLGLEAVALEPPGEVARRVAIGEEGHVDPPDVPRRRLAASDPRVRHARRQRLRGARLREPARAERELRSGGGRDRDQQQAEDDERTAGHGR